MKWDWLLAFTLQLLLNYPSLIQFLLYRIKFVIILILFLLVYQPVLPHVLIRINIRLRSIIIIIYLTTLFHLLTILTHSKLYIYYYLVTIDFILHHTSICIQYMSSWTICLWIVFLSLSSYMNIWWHILWVVFYK